MTDEMTQELQETFVKAINEMGVEEFRKCSWFLSSRIGTDDEG